MNTQEMVAWSIGIISVTALLASPVACTMHRQQAVSKAIDKGADPIEARCAFESLSGDGTTLPPMCIAVAIKNREHADQ